MNVMPNKIFTSLAPVIFSVIFTLSIFMGSATFVFPSSALAAFGDGSGATLPEEQNPLTATARFQPSSTEAGGTIDLIIEMNIAKDYHAYLDRFKLAIDSPDDLKLDEFKIAPIVQFHDTITKKMKDGVAHKATLRALVEVPVGYSVGAHTSKLKLTYQACTDEHCLFPKVIELTAPFQVIAGTGSHEGQPTPPVAKIEAPQSEQAGQQAALANPGNDFQQALTRGTVPALLLMFVVGFLTSLTPCIYPMIPITLSVLGARTKGQSHLRSFSISLVYVLGIALTYSVLGVLAASTGQLFGAALSNIWVVTGIALVFVAMGLSMFGLYELQVPAIIRDRLGGASTSNGGYGGAFVTGLIAGIVASPCVGPVLVSVLTYIAQTQSQMLGFLLLFSFSLGLGVLFIVLGMSSSLLQKLPRAGSWMESVKFIFGTIMIGMAFYYIRPLYPNWLFLLLIGLAAVLLTSFYGAFHPNHQLSPAGRIRKGIMLTGFAIGVSLTVVGVLERAGVAWGSPLAGSGISQSVPKLGWQPYSDAALENALAQGKPVIVDFYAEWCGACNELEAYTFPDQRIRDLSESFVLLKIDATEDFEGLEVLKKRYTVVGLPTMIFYDRQGKIRNELTLTGFEKADEFLARMKAAL